MNFKSYASLHTMKAALKAAGLAGLKCEWEATPAGRRYIPVLVCELSEDVQECNARGFKARLVSLPYNATLAREWHGVPAGTELIVEGRYTDVQDELILKCVRADGEPLPDVNGSNRETRIAADFVEMVR